MGADCRRSQYYKKTHLVQRCRIPRYARKELTLIVLSQLPVARIPDCASTHLHTLMGASCWATCVDCPVATSNALPALSAPPEKILFPSCSNEMHVFVRLQ